MLRVYKIQSVARERKKEKKEKIGREKGEGKILVDIFKLDIFEYAPSNESNLVERELQHLSSSDSPIFVPYLLSSLPSFLSFFFFLIRAHQRKTRGEEKKIAVKSKDAAIAIETRRGESRPRPFKRIPFKLSKRARNVLLIRELAGRKLRGQSSPSCWREPAILQLENRCLLYKETS